MPMNDDPWLPLGDDGEVILPMVAAPVGVYRRAAGGDDSGGWQALDNVRCEWIEERLGPHPANAAFKYVWTGDAEAPQTMEDALSADVVLPKTVDVEDRILVLATRPDGVTVPLFDGYALDFGLVAHGKAEDVDFYAIGRATQLWNDVIDGAYLRDADSPAGGNGYQSNVPARFNPKGVPNCVPEGGERTVGHYSYPVFIDSLCQDVDPAPRKWILPLASQYLVCHHNADETFVSNPDVTTFPDLLVSREPIDGVPFDPSDESTYTPSDIVVPDRLITGHDWPVTLHDLVKPYGFAMAFRLEAGGSDPVTRLDLFLLQATDVKDLWLPARGSDLDLLACNIANAAVRRQTRDVINRWIVEGGLVQYEASFVLWPMFPATSADGSSGNLKSYQKSDPSYLSSNINKYRLYGADETGTGHYAPGTSAKLTTAADLSALFGTKDYAVRRRPAKGGHLITVDGFTKQPIRCRLEYATDYTGQPGLWKSGGTWKPITRGWHPRSDRLGISITADDPNQWSIGDDPSGAPVVLKGVEDQCSVQAGKNFSLRLTCVIEGDDALQGIAERRDASPLSQAITRRIDARDGKYLKQVIHAPSLNNASGSDKVPRDDTDAAAAEADANRVATESGVLDGEVSIPWLTDYYALGDRVRRINGRNLGFRTDGGAPSDTPIYPVVLTRKWTLGSGRYTSLTLSDEAAPRAALERRSRR